MRFEGVGKVERGAMTMLRAAEESGAEWAAEDRRPESRKTEAERKRFNRPGFLPGWAEAENA
jgi:hypothetical protein